MNAFAYINENATTELGRADFAAAAEAGRIRRMQEHRAERDERQRDLDAARREFADFATETYETGRADAESDSDDLEDIASEIVRFVGEMEPKFDALQLAREAEQGSRRKRTRFDAVRLAQLIAREMADELLGEEAGSVLRRATDKAVL